MADSLTGLAVPPAELRVPEVPPDAAGAVTRAPEGLLVWAPDFDPTRPLDRHT